jgi:anti-sigma B factor antagonist
MQLYMVEKVVDGVMVVDLRGRITLGEETEALRGKVKQLVEAGYTRIILNLGGVGYIDSVGLSTLVSSYTSARKQGGDVKLVQLTKRVHDLLQITRLSTVFEIYDSLEEAQRSFGERLSSLRRTAARRWSRLGEKSAQTSSALLVLL